MNSGESNQRIVLDLMDKRANDRSKHRKNHSKKIRHNTCTNTERTHNNEEEQAQKTYRRSKQNKKNQHSKTQKKTSRNAKE